MSYQVFDRRIVEEHMQHKADERLRKKIEGSLLTDKEVRASCLGEGAYFVGEVCETASDATPALMPQFFNVAQAQLQKILKALEV